MAFTALELAAIDPVAAFCLFDRDEFVLLLDSCGHTTGHATCNHDHDHDHDHDRESGRSRYSYLIVQPRQSGMVAASDNPFPVLTSLLSRRPPRQADPALPPFQGGLVAWLSYDSGRFLERLPDPRPVASPFASLWWAETDCVVAWDHHLGKCWVMGESTAARALHLRLSQARALPPLDWSVGAIAQPDLSADQYQQRIQAVIDWIYAGDVFQANLAQRFTAPWPEGLAPVSLYRRLRHLAPAPFAAFLHTPRTSLCSVSPERFMTMNGAGRLETRPIKGSRRRGLTAAEDQALAAELVNSAKDRAENLMILDLMRNDFARICRVGSVRAPQRMQLESFAAIHHLVSVVTGELAAPHGASDVLRATFPPGSITGAPKIRAMEIIHQLETAPRGPYCGTYGWFGDDGAMDLAVAIRIIARQDGQASLWAGGGITADSDPVAEYEETMLKARPLLHALRGA